jgi:hypothetical protein
VGGEADGRGLAVSERKKKEKKGKRESWAGSSARWAAQASRVARARREGRWPDRLRAEKKERRRWVGEERRPAGLEKREGEEGRFWELFFKKKLFTLFFKLLKLNSFQTFCKLH